MLGEGGNCDTNITSVFTAWSSPRGTPRVGVSLHIPTNAPADVLHRSGVALEALAQLGQPRLVRNKVGIVVGQYVSEDRLQSRRWRDIGPHRPSGELRLLLLLQEPGDE